MRKGVGTRKAGSRRVLFCYPVSSEELQPRLMQRWLGSGMGEPTWVTATPRTSAVI